MKKGINVLIALCFTGILNAQKVNYSNATSKALENTSQNSSNATLNQFFYFEIPSCVNGSNIDPSAISSITSNFTDAKQSVKIGFPSIYKKVDDSQNLTVTGFVQGQLKATNGISTLFKVDNPLVEIGGSGGVSIVLKKGIWTLSAPYTKYNYKGGIKKTYTIGDQSSLSMSWLNIIGSISRSNYNLLSPDNSFGNIVTSKTAINGSLYVSFNRYFSTILPRFKIFSCLWSAGVGYAKTDNIASLKSRVYEEGKLVYNSDSTQFQTVIQKKDGNIGTYESYSGLSAFAEAYVPLVKNPKYGSIYVGGRTTFYGLQNKRIINNNSGIFINIKDGNMTGAKPAKDVVSFSVTAQFLQLNKADEFQYGSKNFSVQFQAAVPLRFN